MAQSIVPLVVVLLAGSLALSNANGRGGGFNNLVNPVFCQSKADGLYADPLDSHSFYHCSNSQTYHKQCPANLVFNPAISVCDWPEKVAPVTTKGITVPPFVANFCEAKADGMFADSQNSNAFYHCSNHNTYHKLCQQGLVFNQGLGACVWPSQVPEKVAPVTTQGITVPPFVANFCEAKADGMFADSQNSNAFYHCSNHNTYHKLCQQGLVFNQGLGACVWPSQGV
ncbi:chitin-binding domain protein cbd-1-like isoform X2 [Petromyzon marinus]|uniref:chitin-binding domain protein cbd-1-like isoform X2 n=1 Tax=Petromyzon marinus TaxID=7757 RepID=UPI003F718ACA